MKTISIGNMALILALAPCGVSLGQDIVPTRVTIHTKICPENAPCGTAAGCLWTQYCFPRAGCPDDYVPNPLPRFCQPLYPPFYKCVPAGEGCTSCGNGPGQPRISLWFLPTPRTLREALWFQP
jgi:hypothetical protein